LAWIEVEDHLPAVGCAMRWAQRQAASAGLSEDLQHDLQVCLEEVLTNLIRHGVAGPGGKAIRVGLRPRRGRIIVCVTDRCRPFDPASPTRRPSTDPARIGGRGLDLLRAFAPGLVYRTGDGGNELEMTFHNDPALSDADGDALGSIAAFSKLPPKVLADVLALARPVSFADGERILSQGDASDFALVLIDGAVEVLNQGTHGEAPVARIAAPALVGEIGALAHLPRTAAIRAAGRVRALRLESEDLMAAARHAPEMLASVVGQLGGQIRAVNEALGLYAAGLAALQRDDFDPGVLETLNNPTPQLASFAAAFQDLARRVILERRNRNELASAAMIQQAMLPPAIDVAALAGRCDVVGQMTAARDVGGDLYDVTLLDDRRLAIAVGDVCGKGVPASLFMCATVTALRMAAQTAPDVAALVQLANRTLAARNDMAMFTTLFYAILDLDSGRLDYVNCGHNAPLLLSAAGGCAPLPHHGVPLGLFADRQWPAQSVQLNPGDRLFIFTDGITEAEDPDAAQYGDARLTSALMACAVPDAGGLIDAVLADVAGFCRGAEPSDDITCVALRLP
jgi:serine phosphatase RsbU (regulator of sigma subunit)/anti-sigma regulatory factor (Ser/Thr protein kinase)